MNTLDNLFYPKSIAVVGASSKQGTLSWELVNNMLKYGYEGKIFPINPNSDAVHSIKAYKSVSEIKDIIDLAILMVPKHLTLAAVEDCNRKKIKALIVITAGFKEVGGEGVELERQLVEKITKYKMRLVGPNCMGILNTNPKIKLNGTFVLGTPIPGGIGFVSQSGALGAAVLKTVAQNDIGLAQFISIGNKADISGNVVLDYWKNNDDIRVITVYLESFGNSRKFMKITREITKSKPVIVIKSGRTAAGMKAASSHTGALASSDVVVDAFLEQGGTIRVDNTEEMFDIAKAFDKANLPKGNRVAILTNAGGPAILAVDECARMELTIPELTKKTQKKLREFAPAEASVFNPVDLLPPANAEMYGNATKLILDDPNVDALIAVVGPPLMLNTVEIAHSICRAAKNTTKTVTLVLMSQDDLIPKIREVDPQHPPIYRFPESAARAIGEMLAFEKWKNEPLGKYVNYKADKKEVGAIINKIQKKGSRYLTSDEVYKVLKAYKLPIVETYSAKDIDGAIKGANKIGYPVVVKGSGKNLIHKTEAGAVLLNIQNEAELENSLINLEKKLIQNKIGKPDNYIVQPFIMGGIETIIGVSKDANAGHLIMFGLGGIMVEVFKDVKFKLLPITDVEAMHLIKSVKSYKLLKGVRGKPPVKFELIIENLLRLSQLIQDFPSIVEVDFNPFVVFPGEDYCRILDARIRVE